MKKLLLILLISIFSSTIHAKIGDTYQCQMLSYYSSEIDFVTFEKKELEQFSFKRDKDYIYITPFIGDGFASGYHEITNNRVFNSEDFHVEGIYFYITYTNGYDEEGIGEHGWFSSVLMHAPAGIETVTALCKIVN
jgi:hypothetical protein